MPPAILRFAPAAAPANVGVMPLLRCLSSLGCADLTLAETQALARAHGVDTIELRALEGTTDLPALFARRFGTPAELAAAVRAGGVPVVGLNASLKLANATAADRAALLAYVTWADALGACRLRVFDGGATASPEELAAAAATWRWWREWRAAQPGPAELAVETHDSLFTAAALERFLQAVPDAPILWDAHHTWRKGGEDPLVTWAAIRGRTVHVHIKDSIPVPSARHPFTYVLPGDGGFPVAPLLAALRAEAFAGPVSLEWEKLWHPYLPTLDEALRTAAARRWW